MTATLTAERVRELFEYDPDSGVLSWKGPRKGRQKQGLEAGFLISDGYQKVGIDGRRYPLHRVVWLYVFGVWPEGQIDHVNGVRSDNRISNLRDVTAAVNCQNVRKARGSSKSGLLGASWHKQRNRFQAQIKVDGSSRFLGLYATAEEAHQAYLVAKRQMHPGCCLWQET